MKEKIEILTKEIMIMSNELKGFKKSDVPEEFITVSISWIFNFLYIYILINSKFLGRSEERCETGNKIIDVSGKGRVTWCGQRLFSEK